MGRTKTQTLRLCNQRTKRYELANCSSCTIAAQCRPCKFAQIPCKSYHGTIVCTNANYILARSCENGEDENANPLFVQSTHKAVRACKLFLLHHRLIMQSMEIRSNSRKPYHGTIAALMQSSYKQEAVGMGRTKTQTLRLCNHRTKRYELANCSSCTIPA